MAKISKRGGNHERYVILNGVSDEGCSLDEEPAFVSREEG